MTRSISFLAVIASQLLGAAALAQTSTPTAQTMNAVICHAYGGPENLKYETTSTPVAKAGEVLIAIHSAGVNPVDWKIRDGMRLGRGAEPPMILGYDVSGVIEAVGEGVTDFKPGDEVYSYLPLTRGGGYAEFVAVPHEAVALKPRSIDHDHSAAVPLAALTAHQALFDTAGLEKGQTVLIHAGAGGVGHFAIQLAKAKGAKVIATASEANHPFLRELGADVVIDYRTQKFEEIAKDVDVVLDTIGGDTQERSIGIIKPGGYLVSIVQPPSADKLAAQGIRGTVILVQPNGTQLAELAKMIDDGRLKPHVSHILPLQEAAEAQRLSKTGRTKGKIVLHVR